MDAKANAVIEKIRAMGEQCKDTPASEYARRQAGDPKLAKWARNVKKANIPPRYMNYDFDLLTKLRCPDSVRAIAEPAYRYSRDLRGHVERGEGLLLSGPPGTMKTTIVCCVAQEAIKQGISVYFVSMPELLDTMISMAKNNNPTEFRQFEDHVKRVSLLILDDFGAEYPTDWVMNKVDAIITSRYNNLRPTIITSNLMRDEMQKRYVGRIFDRLKGTCALLTAQGASLRKPLEL